MGENNQNNKQLETQNGSFIIWIFIAVLLFGALGFAFSSGNRGSTSLISDAQVKAYASEIISYGNEMRQAVKRMELSGCSDLEISAQRDWNGNGTVQDTNPDGYIAAAPVDKSCHIYDSNGGNIIYKDFKEGLHIISGTHRISTLGCDDGNYFCPEIVFAVKGLSQNMCEAINKLLSINTMPTDNSGENGFALYDAFPAGGGTSIGDQDTNLEGRKIACYLDSDDGTYHFYQVLVTR